MAWALIVAFYLITRLQLLNVPIDRDEGTFGSAGQAILRGELPYRDFFDHKPPGLFYLYAAVMAIEPATPAGLHAFLHLWNFLALLALAYIAWKLAGRTAALWTAFVYAVVSIAPSLQGFATTSELVGLAPLAGSLALAVSASSSSREGRGRDLRMLLVGVIAAITVLIKPPLALALLPTPLLFRARSERWIRDTAAWVVGGALVGALAALAFVAAGAWKEFWYWNVTHNALYDAHSWEGWQRRLRVVLRYLSPDLLVPLLLATIGCFRLLVKRHRDAWFVTAFLLLSIASCFQSGYFSFHYFAQALLAIGLAAGLGAAAVAEAVARTKVTRLAATAALASVVIALPVMSRPWYWITPDPVEVIVRVTGPQAFEASPMVAEYLRTRTAPGDSVWVFANEPQITFMAERRNANPFLMMYPLWSGLPREREFQERAWREVQAHPPAYVVVARSPIIMLRAPETNPWLEQHLAAMLGRAYVLESCLSLQSEGLVFDTELPRKGTGCTGQTVLELWQRRPAPRS